MTNPVITLGGQEFTIPMLAPRQQRIVGPAAMSLLPIMDKLRQGDVSLFKDPACYDALVDVVFPAVQRGTPDMTRDQFMDTSMTMTDLITAFPVVLRQAGFFKEVPNEGKPQAASLTGTESLPISGSPLAEPGTTTKTT